MRLVYGCCFVFGRCVLIVVVTGVTCLYYIYCLLFCDVCCVVVCVLIDDDCYHVVDVVCCVRICVELSCCVRRVWYLLCCVSVFV